MWGHDCFDDICFSIQHGRNFLGNEPGHLSPPHLGSGSPAFFERFFNRFPHIAPA